MIRFFLLLFLTINCFRSEAQGLMEFSGKEWTFGFLMIPGEEKTITTNYHATSFEIRPDSTFAMGMSEAAESGVIHADSTLTIQLYDYNSDAENSRWAESFRIWHCSENYLILVQQAANYNWYYSSMKGFGDIWFVYCRKDVGRVSEAKKIYKKLRKELSF